MFTFIILSFAVTAVTILWRTFLLDYPNIEAHLQKHWSLLGKALTCGICFPVWFSLIGVLLFNPFPGYVVPTTFVLSPPLPSVLTFFVLWFALGFAVLVERFILISIIEGTTVIKQQQD